MTASSTPATAVSRQSDAAYERLRLMIIRTELAPGALIEEPGMMERLGVGRTPLREALFRLVQENLVENVPRRGYFVAQVSASDFFSLFEVRRELEGLSARLAARRVTAEGLQRLADLVLEAQSGVAQNNHDPEWNLGLDERFHLLIADLANNAHLREAVARYYGLSVRALYRSHLAVALIAEEAWAYEEMLDALRRGDAAAAENVMRRHLDINPIKEMLADVRGEHEGSDAAQNVAGGSR